jgi:ElaB/YqjD/DUF883 family membrane-anchored ribosome-binding protein
MSWVALVAEVVGELGKLIASAVNASREQAEAVEEQLRRALDELRTTRNRIEDEVGKRHAALKAEIDAAVARDEEAMREVSDSHEANAAMAAIANQPPPGSSER